MRMIMRFMMALSLFLSAPVCVAAVAADPAVIHANKIAKDDIVYSEGYFGTGNNRLHYVEAGKGPLIILYHGFPSFWYSWFDQMEVLKSRYHVVAVDGLGSGLSAKPAHPEAYRVARLAGQIDRLARHLNGKKKFTLIGHDWGAAFSFAYAQAYPKRLNAVIGMSAPPYNLFLDLLRTNKDQQARSTYMQTFRNTTLDAIKSQNLTEVFWKLSYGKLIERGELSEAEGALFRAALADPLALDGGMNWYRANVPALENMGAATGWPVHDRPLKVPALLIWGTADQTFVPEFLVRMEAVAPGVKVVEIAGVNHWTSMEKPDLAKKAIVDFLQQNSL